MAFGSGDNQVDILVKLVTEQATKAAEAFKEGLIEGLRDAAREADKAEKKIQEVGEESKKAGEKASTGFSSLQKKIIVVNQALEVAQKAFAALQGTVAKFVQVVSDGDKFGDITTAFENNAKAAGVLADELRGNLSAAFDDTISDIELLSTANKAFALGLDPKQFDDLAAAAKRYADATGGDARQALDELISGVNTGREAFLRKFGTVKDGVLILDAFNAATAKSGQEQANVTDIIEQFRASLSNTYNRVAQAINESEALALAIKGITTAISTLLELLGDLIVGFVDLTNRAIKFLRGELEKVINGFAVLGELFAQIGRKETPSLSKAIGAVASQMKAADKEGGKVEKVLVKLGGASKKTADELKKFEKAISDAFEQSDINLNELLGLESFVIPGTLDSLRDRLKKAFLFINPNEIRAELVKVRTAFLDGITGTPEEIAAETQKRLQIIASEAQKVKDALEGENPLAKKDEEKVDPAKIFGIEIDGMSKQLAAAIEGSINNALSLVAQEVSAGLGREQAAAIGQTIGTAIGAAIGAVYGSPEGGAIIGGVVGQILGTIAAKLGGDSAGTRTRKDIDRYFADIFDADRISVVVNGQLERIKDLTFEGGTLFGGGVDFGGENFFGVFNTMSQEAQAGLTGLGAAFAEFAGVREEEARLIGAAFTNNVGTSIENIRALVQSTGKGFEELGEAIVQAFYNGLISIEEFYQGMKQLEDVFAVGFADAIGDVDRAIENFNTALADGRGSRQLINSIRDMAAEAEEIQLSFPALVDRIGQSLGFTAQQTTTLLEFLKNQGIDTVEELKNASLAELAAFLEGIRRIMAGASTIAELPTPISNPTEGVEQPGLFTRGGPTPSATVAGGAAGTGLNDAKRKAEALRKEREREFQSLYKLVTASAQYENILAAINSQQLTQKEGTKEIRDLFDEVKKATNALEKAEDNYQKALKKRKGNLAEASRAVEEARDALNKLTETGNKANEIVLKFDTSRVLPLVKTINEFGIVAKAAGVSLAGMVSTLVEGFIRGRKSLSDFRTELEKLEDTMGGGIPGAVGAVGEAIDNLFRGGRNGGLFSIDAFKDIFAEIEEQFKTTFGERRRSELQRLTTDFNQARDAYQALLATPGAAAKDLNEAKARLEGAQKALNDFNATKPTASFADLRFELEKKLSPKQVDIFFEGLRNAGIDSFEGVRNASAETITRILSDIDKMGFGFGETEESVRAWIKGLDDAAIAQTNGNDILGEALRLVQDFNSFSGQLPSLFNATAVEVAAMNGPLAAVSQQVSDIFNKLASLGDAPFNADVVLNVAVGGNNSALKLVDVLFGDGSNIVDDGDDSGPGVGGLTDRQRGRRRFLRRKKRQGGLTAREQAQLDKLNSLAG